MTGMICNTKSQIDRETRYGKIDRNKEIERERKREREKRGREKRGREKRGRERKREKNESEFQEKSKYFVEMIKSKLNPLKAKGATFIKRKEMKKGKCCIVY